MTAEFLFMSAYYNTALLDELLLKSEKRSKNVKGSCSFATIPC
jgi:hypothetical protein